MTQFTKQELTGKTVVELRRLARDQVRLDQLELSVKLENTTETIGHWIVCANAKQLISALQFGIVTSDSEDDDDEQPESDNTDDNDGVSIHGAPDFKWGESGSGKTAKAKQDTEPEPQPEPKSDLEELIAKIANDEANIVYDAKSGNGISTQSQALTIKRPDLPDMTIKNTHNLLKKVLIVLSLTKGNGTHLSVYLWGPSASGKTTMAKQCANAFGVKFFPLSCAKDDPSYKVFGYCTADGTYIASSFRECYESGGVYLMDEVDMASDSTTVSLNTALGNGYCLFPDGKLINAHKDFYFIAGGNTTLAGATARYSARRKLDAAFGERLDVFFEMTYDPAIETIMAYGNLEWRDYVWSVREAVKYHSIDHLVTPRAIERGAILLKAGLSRREVEDCAIWRGLSQDDITMIKRRIKEATATPDTSESEAPQSKIITK